MPSSTSSQDSALLARIRAGDRAACDLCIELHAPAVRRLALRMTLDQAEAEDVVQETFLQAFRSIEQFDGRAQIGTWLHRIAYNVALMRQRRAAPEQVPVDEEGGLAGQALVPRALFDWCCLPEPELDKAEVRAELESAINAMPEKLRAVFVLREVEGLSTKATADALGVSVDVTKTRLRRARLWLRARLAAYFPAVPSTGAEPAGRLEGKQ
jgi:RNA polymerase sigma-70 factor (ECF subfamily)